MKSLFLAILFLIFSAFFSTTSADEGWTITSFNSDLSIQNDGKVRVEETISVDFNTLEKHGIFRDIPVVYEGENGQKIYTSIEVEDVNQDGEDAKFEENEVCSYIQLKIGDASKTISGRHTYEIIYTATGILKSFPEHDELYWNVTGNAWPVPIVKASSTVSLDKEALTQITCYQGHMGSQELCNSSLESSKSASFITSRPLSENEGLTVVAGFAKNTVPILTVNAPPTLRERISFLRILIAFITTALTGIFGSFLLWQRKGRDIRFLKTPLLGGKNQATSSSGDDTVVAEYTPPENIRPAELGVLMDERADTLDVTATIIDLATRGYLDITEIDKKWLFGSTDYTLKKKSVTKEDLLPYEKELYTRLFDDGDEVKISSLKQKFYTDLKKVKDQLYSDLTKKGYFPKNPESVKNIYTALSIGGIVLAGFLLGGGMFVLWGIPFGIGLGLMASSIFFLFFSRSMSRRTATGSEMYRRAKGYELFIGNVEKHRQQFFEKKNMFNVVLPYAIVLGLTEKFAKGMEEIGAKSESPSWYHSSSGRFNPVIFSSNINSFSNSMSSAIASAPKSSGFSGGGSSGGGFGGGGGGSW